ncbi:terpene synthase family protein [Archangium sp.]|uniref:terpene synthase family protein n=1 Tax=Archangium sp. TaxID=1872627 RepID=UPI00286B8A54|nr:hypothetical protein [Archangium sp.]
MSASRLLEPLRTQMRDARHWELTCRLLDWSLQHLKREEPSALARRAYVASTFDTYCGAPGASLEEHLLGASFLVAFFTADDGPDEALKSFLATADAAPSAPTELRTCHDAWLEGMGQTGQDLRGPRAAFRTLCEWMLVERRVDPSTVTEAQYRELRQYTIAVPLYVGCWKALRALRPSERADEALRRSGLLELTTELVYLANDLGSLERDEEAARRQQPDAELNLVILRTRVLGSRQEAIRQVLAQYHERLQDFRRRRAELADTEHWRERAVRDSVEHQRAVVNGNVATTLHLMALRYPGALGLLKGLPELEPLPSPD